MAIMPRSLLSVPRYSDFWELAGGRGEPVVGREEKREEKRCEGEGNGEGLNQWRDWQRVGRRRGEENEEEARGPLGRVH